MYKKNGRAAGLAYHHLGREAEEGQVPLLLLPGLLEDSTSSSLQRLAHALGQRRPVLLIDPLGSGQSERPTDPAEYDWPGQVARLQELLVRLSLPQVDAVGLSLGGMWLQQLLHRAPERLRCAVLVASAAAMDARMRCIIDALLGQVEAGLPTELLHRSLLPLLFSPEFLDRGGVVPMLLTLLGERPADAAALRGQLLALRAHDIAEKLRGAPGHKVRRLIFGEMDWLVPAPAQRRLRAALGEGACEQLVLPRAGHCLWVEEPQALAAAVEGGLAGMPFG